jgi:hypothetical protein
MKEPAAGSTQDLLVAAVSLSDQAGILEEVSPRTIPTIYVL